jgi:hypothetical protein
MASCKSATAHAKLVRSAPDNIATAATTEAAAAHTTPASSVDHGTCGCACGARLRAEAGNCTRSVARVDFTRRRHRLCLQRPCPHGPLRSTPYIKIHAGRRMVFVRSSRKPAVTQVTPTRWRCLIRWWERDVHHRYSAIAHERESLLPANHDGVSRWRSAVRSSASGATCPGAQCPRRCRTDPDRTACRHRHA